MEERYVGVILAVVLFLIVFSLETYNLPRFAPDCGECTPWEGQVCGGTLCGPHFMSYSRNCAMEYDPEVEVMNPIPADIRFSMELTDCTHMCEYDPDLCNSLPDISNPRPIDGVGDQLISGVVLDWDAVDENGDDMFYDVYFGESLVLVSSNQTSDTYALNDLELETTYYWQIVAKDWYWGAQIGETIGPVWSFTTGVFNDPPTVQLLTPPHSSFDNPLLLNLTWNGEDANDDILTYDVYFGSSSNPPFNITTSNNYTEISNLDFGATYYWRVNVSDGQDSELSGVWRFTTEEYNDPPTIQLNSPINGSINNPLLLNLTWNGSDSDNDSLIYDIYFDNETNPSFFVSTLDNYTEISNLDYGETYYWIVNVSDGVNTVSSNEFIFTTEEESETLDSNPSSGRSSSKKKVSECAPGCTSFWVGDGECDFICNVTECDYDGGDCKEEGYILFDIKVFLEDEYPKLLPGTDVPSDIVLYNFGTIRPVDVYLECAIEDLSEDKNKIDFFTETLAVSVQTSINRNLRIPEGTAPGRYVYNCYMTYAADQEPIYSGDLFEVVGSVELPEERTVGIDYTIIIYEFFLANWMWFAIGFGALLIIIFIIILVKRRKKKKKVKKVVVVPVGKGPVSPNNLFGESFFAWAKRLLIRVFRSGVRQ